MVEASALDLVIAAAALLVAAGLFVAWRRVGEPALILFAVGLALKAVGYATGGAGEFEITHRPASAAELARLATLFAGNLVMVTAYLGGHGRRRWLALGWALAGAALAVALLDLLAPPLGALDLAVISPTMHAVVALANVGCGVFAAQGYRASPQPSRALVPAAFLLWGLSNYTSLLIDLGTPSGFGLWVQAWRLLAVLLMLAALVVPRRAPEVTPPAEA
jgi:hypothetical protein